MGLSVRITTAKGAVCVPAQVRRIKRNDIPR